MSTAMATADRPAGRRYLQLGIIWALLLTVPLWLPLLGGYTAIAGRVLVFALAAMSFNMLLGFTGVMSFGHAAYFGLGAYGAGLFLKFVSSFDPLGHTVRHAFRRRCRHLVRLAAGSPSWGLFRDGDDRLRPGLFLRRL